MPDETNLLAAAPACALPARPCDSEEPDGAALLAMLAALVEAIGAPEFLVRLETLCARIVQARRTELHLLAPDGTPRPLAGPEARPPCSAPEAAAFHDDLRRARSRPAKDGLVLAVSGHDLPRRGDLRPGRRLLLVTRGRDPDLCLRLLRDPDRPAPGPGTLARLQDVAGLLISAAARHAERLQPPADGPAALASLDEIATCLAGARTLSTREIQVCARMLHGLTSTGIALDLGIGRESVATYRKRAYQRLGIASQRELLVWYLTRREQAPRDQPPEAPASRTRNPSSTRSTRNRS